MKIVSNRLPRHIVDKEPDLINTEYQGQNVKCLTTFILGTVLLITHWLIHHHPVHTKFLNM